MKRFLALLVIAAITMVVMIFITNPEVLDKVWLWMIGFAGHILLLTKKIQKILTKGLQSNNKTDATHA